SVEEKEGITSPSAWLMTVLTRICLDQLKSAATKKEQYFGVWLPEPFPEGYFNMTHKEKYIWSDSNDDLAIDDSVSMALMVVLEKMTPAERICFMLHDIFQYSFNEISNMTGKSPDACRQLAFSARKRVN